VSSIGEDGLTSIFDLAPKQLHYILNILESNELTKKQVLASEKKRSLIHLTRFALKRKTLIDLICDHLLIKHETKRTGYMDSTANIRRKLGLTLKQLKSIVQQAERQNVFKRCLVLQERRNPALAADACVMSTSTASLNKKIKPLQVRMLTLTESHYNAMINSRRASGTKMSSAGDEDDEEVEQVASSGDLDLIYNTLGTGQSSLQPMHSQIFAHIEACGAEGMALKQMGMMFGLDFYKARRMGHNLQMHPDIVTIIKETNRGKAKYQTIMLRKFVNAGQSGVNKNAASSSQNLSLNESMLSAVDPLSQTADDSLSMSMVVEHECGGSSRRNIQALVSNRTVTRQKLMLDYLAEHRICTKYEINREIRTRETELGLKGQIDSKTTKRMLRALEAEGKLKLFEVNLRNVFYLCVRAVDIDEEDEVFKNYCHTYRRTFEADELKMKKGKDC
jgi:hypothetical protein